MIRFISSRCGRRVIPLRTDLAHTRCPQWVRRMCVVPSTFLLAAARLGPASVELGNCTGVLPSRYTSGDGKVRSETRRAERDALGRGRYRDHGKAAGCALTGADRGSFLCDALFWKGAKTDALVKSIQSVMKPALQQLANYLVFTMRYPSPSPAPARPPHCRRRMVEEQKQVKRKDIP